MGTLESRLDDQAQAIILNLIDHNETGVALQLIFDYLVERQFTVPSSVRRAMQTLAARMSMTSLDWSVLVETNVSE